VEAQLDGAMSERELIRRLEHLVKGINYMHDRREKNVVYARRTRRRRLEKLGVNLEQTIKCF